MVDLLSEDAAQDGAPVLERHGGLLRNRGEQRRLVVREGRVPVGHQLAYLTWPFQRSGSRTA